MRLSEFMKLSTLEVILLDKTRSDKYTIKLTAHTQQVKRYDLRLA